MFPSSSSGRLEGKKLASLSADSADVAEGGRRDHIDDHDETRPAFSLLPPGPRSEATSATSRHRTAPADVADGASRESGGWFDRELLGILRGALSYLAGQGPARDGRKDALPPSLPNRWPQPGPADLQERPRRVITIGGPQQWAFRSNFVVTSKYTPWTFLPLFLLEEFNPRTKVANCYFLLIAMLQCVPSISNTRGYPTTLFPLFIVVLVDGVFQAIEDLSRHRADALANASVAHR